MRPRMSSNRCEGVKVSTISHNRADARRLLTLDITHTRLKNKHKVVAISDDLRGICARAREHEATDVAAEPSYSAETW